MKLKKLFKINNKTNNSELSRIIAGSMIIFCENEFIAINLLSLDSELERLITVALFARIWNNRSCRWCGCLSQVTLYNLTKK